MSQTIFFSVGEPSGDQHAARLIESLKRQSPQVCCRGFGGKAMSAAGCDVDLDLTQHAVVGILEVLPKLRQFFRFADQAEAIFAGGGIDAVVLVDFPGFNWHIARRAKKYGIPVIYYCPPQLWAWAGWRIRKMKATVDHVLAVLPIEESYFSKRGIPTSFVGHPFFDSVDESDLDEGVLSELLEGACPERSVAVLPGSRTHEVHRNWPIMLDAIAELSEKYPGHRFAVAAYRASHRQWCESEALRRHPTLPIDFYEDATSEIIDYCSCAMMVSGSVSLELMARRTPAVVLYRVGRFLYAFGKCVVKVDSVTLPNLMPDPENASADNPAERAFPEIISVGDPSVARAFLVENVGRMMSDPEYLKRKREQLVRLGNRYATPGASGRAAARLAELIEDAAPLMQAQRAA